MYGGMGAEGGLILFLGDSVPHLWNGVSRTSRGDAVCLASGCAAHRTVAPHICPSPYPSPDNRARELERADAES